MRPKKNLLLLFLFPLFAKAFSQEKQEETTAPTSSPDYVLEEIAFVENDAATSVSQSSFEPLKLSYWTTPDRDWDDALLFQMKALIRRFEVAKLLQFHPHTALELGENIGCREPGNEPITDLSDACLDACVNAGRYCAVQYNTTHTEDDDSHAGLLGSDLVLESARRLCVWIVYGSVHKEEGAVSMQYWDYIETLRDTNCDQSLSDNCIDRVYREVGIGDHKIMSCFQNAGGVGVQIDMKNMFLDEEAHRSQHLDPNTDLPQLAVNGKILPNATQLSSYDIAAFVCSAMKEPPKICDFCLNVCPVGNPDRDPTSQCMWELRCDEIRTFDDWMKQQGPFDKFPEYGLPPNDNGLLNDNSTETNATSSATYKDEPFDDNQTGDGNEPDMESMPSVSPSLTPTTVAKEANHHVEDTEEEEAEYSFPDPGRNFTDTNATTYDDDNDLDTNATEHRPTTPTPAPTHSAKGGTLANKPGPPRTNPAGNTNTSNPQNATGKLLITVIVLSGLVAGLLAVQKWNTKRQQRKAYDNVERAANGLASTASHTTTHDLSFNVELPTTSKGRYGSAGYAPPPTAPKGTWG